MIRPLFLITGFYYLIGCSAINKEVKTFAQDNQYHAGFYLYDPVKKEVLADYQSEKYFTPASNTKILTLYASKLILDDPLPEFYIKKDSNVTYLWPTGNPSFLNPVLSDSINYKTLAEADSLVLSFANWQSDRFGSGWSWDDYNSSYSPELSPFPIYSNFATFTLDSLDGSLSVSPSFLMDSITIIEGESFKVERREGSNRFEVAIGPCNDCVRQRPFRLTEKMLAKIFSDTLDTPVSISTDLVRAQSAEILYGLPQDSVFKVMMQETDNFIAEQLLLQVATVLTDTLNSTIGIDSLQYYLKRFMPDSSIWVDGSGLSRYNMTTPRNLVMLWNELLGMFGQERLMAIVAIGGVAGTIENWYAEEQPYIFGKTGTLRHNHDLSGLLIAKSGRLLLFSYMNNHYQSSSSNIKQNMEHVLHKIYEKY
jgi:D-alanyl-D-alanine carboxypeptidase/D-alanyl-D-alanine-endopeptidase (penicillin-binding protein 4)